MTYTSEKIDKSYFQKNRKNFISKMKDSSIAIFQNGTAPIKDNDTEYPFRTDNNFWYMTGLEIPEAKLIIYPDEPRGKVETLFIPPSNPEIEAWIGKRLTVEEAKEQTGIENVMVLNSFNTMFMRAQSTVENLYICYNDVGFMKGRKPFLDFIEKVKYYYPGLNLKKANLILAELRQIKSQEEIKMINKAINITHKAMINVWENLKPGIFEYEIMADFISIFIKNGCKGFGFEPIIATGRNSATLHYINNNSKLEDGHLILFDLGAEYLNYSADISRTVPVNGKFSKEHKEVYKRVLDIQKELIDFIKPNITFKEINEKTEELISGHLVKLGYIEDKKDFKKYYMHSFGHHLGLSVHDIGPINQPLTKGNVITVEPGIYCYDKGFGVRIEDDILITDNGNEVLSKNIPKEIDEIESIVGSKIK